MNMLIGAFQLICWAMVGLLVLFTGGLVLVVGLLAFVGRMVWYLAVQRDQGRSVSVGPINTPDQGE